MVIQRIGVLSLAKVLGALYGGLGLFFGAIVSLVSFFGAAFSQAAAKEPGGQFIAMFFGMGAIILLPLLYGAIGFISGALSALIYNLVAGVAGGLEIEVR